MSGERVIVVHLRQPRRGDPDESRSDPFYEFGSFGCTRCHSRNLMHLGKAHELAGARFAFAQGGPLGFRLVHLTPPVSLVRHTDRCEVLWTPVEAPFRYGAAPVLVDGAGRTAFPRLLVMLSEVDRETWPARFSSAFRSRRTPLPPVAADEMARVFDRLRATANPAALVECYADALPYRPNRVDSERARTLAALRAAAQGESVPDSQEQTRHRAGDRVRATREPRTRRC